MSKTIMIVDDEQMTRRLVSYVLKGAGCTVIECDSAQRALDQLAGRGVDMILTDLNMPGMDGLALISEIRKRPETKSTPILMLTMESDGERKQQGKRAGANGWIVKPFTPPKLIEVVSKVLDTKLTSNIAPEK